MYATCKSDAVWMSTSDSSSLTYNLQIFRSGGIFFMTPSFSGFFSIQGREKQWKIGWEVAQDYPNLVCNLNFLSKYVQGDPSARAPLFVDLKLIVYILHIH